MLFWRHVAFYLDPERVDAARPDVGLGLADTLKARNSNAVNISAFDVPTLRENLSYEFRRLSEKVTGLDLVSFFQAAIELFPQAPDPVFLSAVSKERGTQLETTRELHWCRCAEIDGVVASG